ncbi:MAG TPA: GNAT family N-acetyltransferase [Planctomycetes bacterium]|nr:GNAT family N-acetyltransferase [Planctomycetota bacterium]
MIRIRLMRAEDLPTCMLLREHAGFNQTEADWRRFMALQPDGCFVAEWEGRPVGTVTNCLFGPIGWIAMLLVHKQFRGRGIGTRLMQHAMEYLDQRGVATMRLDATPMGRPIYEKLGFVAEYGLVRLQGIASAGGQPRSVRCATSGDLGSILHLDRQVTGTDRSRLIRRLYQENPQVTRVISAPGGQLLGYITARPGMQATQIGPGVAVEADAGRALADAALAHCAGRPVFIDIPLDNRAAMRWARDRGLEQQRPFTRMRRGAAVENKPALMWASSGPEKG